MERLTALADTLAIHLRSGCNLHGAKNTEVGIFGAELRINR